MKIDLTEKQFRRLLDLVYVGNWVMNSTRGDDRIQEYDDVESAVFAHCLSHGMVPLVEAYQGELIPSRAFAEGGIHEAIMAYEDVTFFEILAEELPGYAVAALSGPSHAEEVAREMPTGCVAACPEKAIAEWVQGIFMNPSFRVYSSTDITGVELCGAAKNIIALAAGMAEGMGCGDNAKALMMSRALVELSALIKAAGGQENTCFGLAGMGDMIVTCTSPHSRNHMAGVAIGRGEHVAGDLGERHAVVEGYYAAALIEECGLKGRRVGGAQVSEKHAGFIVNTGGATCQDVLGLIGEIQREVFAQKGVRLETEVRVTGEA